MNKTREVSFHVPLFFAAVQCQKKYIPHFQTICISVHNVYSTVQSGPIIIAIMEIIWKIHCSVCSDEAYVSLAHLICVINTFESPNKTMRLDLYINLSHAAEWFSTRSIRLSLLFVCFFLTSLLWNTIE